MNSARDGLPDTSGWKDGELWLVRGRRRWLLAAMPVVLVLSGLALTDGYRLALHSFQYMNVVEIVMAVAGCVVLVWLARRFPATVVRVGGPGVMRVLPGQPPRTVPWTAVSNVRAGRSLVGTDLVVFELGPQERLVAGTAGLDVGEAIAAVHRLSPTGRVAAPPASRRNATRSAIAFGLVLGLALGFFPMRQVMRNWPMEYAAGPLTAACDLLDPELRETLLPDNEAQTDSVIESDRIPQATCILLPGSDSEPSARLTFTAYRHGTNGSHSPEWLVRDRYADEWDQVEVLMGPDSVLLAIAGVGDEAGAAVSHDDDEASAAVRVVARNGTDLVALTYFCGPCGQDGAVDAGTAIARQILESLR